MSLIVMMLDLFFICFSTHLVSKDVLVPGPPCPSALQSAHFGYQAGIYRKEQN